MDRVNGRVVTKQNISGKLGMPSGTKDYNLMTNKPSIEDVVLMGNKTMADFGDRELSNIEIQDIIDSVFNS